ncbi:MAG: NAD(P)-dependent oxidoreductase [Anaerolineae bacterium]|nr:NAD(P)-dependent oxidoreductase [Anaerolineae bacterium]MBT7075215.1 NAD(P)-dependent oxidoreductase [Anaerolineae bacterium]
MQAVPSENLAINRKKRAQEPFLELNLRPAEERVCDFEEVAIGFTPEEAIIEAARCIHCPDPAPCMLGCPTHNDIPSAMWLIEQGRFADAAKLYHNTSALPEVCGRVCPHEQLCEGACVLNKTGEPVITGQLEVFALQQERTEEPYVPEVAPSTGQKVAIVGAGPAGLGCADELLKLGHQVTLFDSKPAPGGLLVYGIPNFKISKDVFFERWNDMVKLGAKFVGNTYVGRDTTIDEILEQGFDAMFVGVGSGIDAPMDIDGEDLPGVYEATDFLIRGNVSGENLPKDKDPLPDLGNDVVVIGGGDTASDCLRTSVRRGIENVICLYRRTEAEMPGSAKDRKLARQEGAKYSFLTQPVKFIAGADGKLAAVECIQMELGEPDDSGRRRPVAVEGSNFSVPATTAVKALGYWPDEIIGKTTPDYDVDRWGLTIVKDSETGQTSRENIFAGGDGVTGPDLVVTAMVAGKKSAKAIDEYLKNIK